MERRSPEEQRVFVIVSSAQHVFPLFLSDSILHVVTPPTRLLQTCVRVSTGAGNHAYSLRSPVVPYTLRISLPSRLCGTSAG